MRKTIRQPLLTSEVARLAGVSAGAVILWERAGLLRATKTAAGVRLFKRRDVERFLGDLLSGHKTRSVYDRYIVVAESDLRLGVARLADTPKGQ